MDTDFLGSVGAGAGDRPGSHRSVHARQTHTARHTANAGVIFGRRFFSSRFRHEVRARETPHFDAWFADHGFTVEHLPEGVYFEGAGDALFCGPALVAGYRIRSDVRGHQHLAQLIGKQVLPLELINPRFYHLDTCFCPLAPGEALYYPPAFDATAARCWGVTCGTCSACAGSMRHSGPSRLILRGRWE